jgi:hypothetical protein
MKEEWQILCVLLLLYVTSASGKQQDEVRCHLKTHNGLHHCTAVEFSATTKQQVIGSGPQSVRGQQYDTVTCSNKI